MMEPRSGREETKRTMSRNPYVFVVGCPRSGTTLLQRMLDHHPRLAVANDTHFIPRAVTSSSTGADLPLTADLIERVRTYRRFPRLGLAEAAVDSAAANAHTYRGFVSALYSEFAAMHGKPLGGEKTPDYVRCLPFLHALFPWVKTLHIIRDGRDVALSTLEWANEDKGPGKFQLWREEPYAVCALWWRWQVYTGRRDGRELGAARYHEISYEDLIASPEQTLQAAADFLQLRYAPEMAAYHVGKTKNAPGLSAKEAWLPPTPGLRDWRTQMAKRDLELFEALAGDLLSDLGYERCFARFSPEILALARRCRDWWEAEMTRRQARAPGRLDCHESLGP